MTDWKHLKSKHFLPWKEEWEMINKYGNEKIPFAFIVDFLGEQIHVWPLDKINPQVHFDFPNFKTSRIPKITYSQNDLFLLQRRIPKKDYEKIFNKVMEEIQKGNTYLINLCAQNEISILRSLADIFVSAEAPYKFLWEEKFTFFSPESFITIKDNQISAYPMKGTSCSLSDKDKEILLNDQKEISEHNTVVDLLRNDLGQVSDNVTVAKYRYLDKIETDLFGFWQASSQIVGDLKDDWHSHIGDILYLLCPAGSITGAPKQKTNEIIKRTELTPRNYYTGITGVYDGTSLETAVNIRYIENLTSKYVFKSGGGITFQSKMEKEYDELLRKIQIPISVHRNNGNN